MKDLETSERRTTTSMNTSRLRDYTQTNRDKYVSNINRRTIEIDPLLTDSGGESCCNIKGVPVL